MALRVVGVVAQVVFLHVSHGELPVRVSGPVDTLPRFSRLVGVGSLDGFLHRLDRAMSSLKACVVALWISCRALLDRRC